MPGWYLKLIKCTVCIKLVLKYIYWYLMIRYILFILLRLLYVKSNEKTNFESRFIEGFIEIDIDGL